MNQNPDQPDPLALNTSQTAANADAGQAAAAADSRLSSGDEAASVAADAALDSVSGQAPPRLWNKNFFLLWQGQLVSAIGDVFYQVALGFWVLAETGSTGLMGALMAASTLPRVILSPFMGVLADRMDRRKIIVLMDAIRGLAVLGVAGAALFGVLEIWMVFTAGVVIGLGASIFDTAVASTLPDLLNKSKFMQGNSVFSTIQTLSGVAGNSLGGIVYALVGAPIMFLINGISYVASAVSEAFIKIPKIQHKDANFNYKQDMITGLRFVKENKAVGVLFLNIGTLNFFLVLGGVLFLPYFERSVEFGAPQYGIMMAILTAGSFLGAGLLGLVRVPKGRTFGIFVLCASLFGIGRSLLFVFPILPVIFTIAFFVGFSVAIINTSIVTTMQRIVPQHLRGKIMGLGSAFAGGLIPVGMALGGVLAEFLPIQWIVTISGAISFLAFLPVFFNREIRRFMNES